MQLELYSFYSPFLLLLQSSSLVIYNPYILSLSLMCCLCQWWQCGILPLLPFLALVPVEWSDSSPFSTSFSILRSGPCGGGEPGDVIVVVCGILSEIPFRVSWREGRARLSWEESSSNFLFRLDRVHASWTWAGSVWWNGREDEEGEGEGGEELVVAVPGKEGRVPTAVWETTDELNICMRFNSLPTRGHTLAWDVLWWLDCGCEVRAWSSSLCFLICLAYQKKTTCSERERERERLLTDSQLISCGCVCFFF